MNIPDMTLRDYFAIHAPQPSDIEINIQMVDRTANPYNDNYKPQRRSRSEIIVDLRYAFADAMIAKRSAKS